MVAAEQMTPECRCDKAPKFFPDDWRELSELLKKGIDQMCEVDEFLLLNEASERTIVHRLGVSLESIFPEWNVDCEYNRIGNTKGMKVQPREELCYKLAERSAKHGFAAEQLEKAKDELKCAAVEAGERDLERRAYPDLILHKRGCELHNLLIMEVKTTGTEPWRTLIDLTKFHSFTLAIRRTVLKKTYDYPRYRFGLFLEFGNKGLSFAMLFENGVHSPLDLHLSRQ